ncbi:MAG: alpha-1,2-fucosyltransferase [Prevotella sp.]|nr:alpha-1,2-fucosyltransferase [Prevotella sp.]
MIFVHDKGRMANNMLQYGHVYAWGRAHGRTTMSMRFAYKYPWFQICETPHHNFMTYLFAKYGAKWGLIPTVHFDQENADYSHEEQMMLDRRMIVVTGWYARWYDLFEKYKPEIRKLFAFNTEILGTSRLRIGEGNAVRVGVHVRRGDYKTHLGGRFYYDDAQYVGVLKQFKVMMPDTKINFFVCGNDPQLNKDFFRRELTDELCKVEFPDGNPAEDMCLLSLCDWLIGAPSTFSLVAALYREVPLYWIEDPKAPLKKENFKSFNELFRHIY